MKTIITFGTFDLFHIGHLNMLERAKNYGDKLVVGISTDKFNFEKKNKYPIYNQEQRKKIIENIKFVDDVFFEESMEKKKEYVKKFNANILIMGDDWKGKFDHCNDLCQVIYLSRTPSISTTQIIEFIQNK